MSQFYFGFKETAFNEKYGRHKQSLNNKHYKNISELPKYVWWRKEEGKAPDIGKILENDLQ